jgi:hypothetical protein
MLNFDSEIPHKANSGRHASGLRGGQSRLCKGTVHRSAAVRGEDRADTRPNETVLILAVHIRILHIRRSGRGPIDGPMSQRTRCRYVSGARHRMARDAHVLRDLLELS